MVVVDVGTNRGRFVSISLVAEPVAPAIRNQFNYVFFFIHFDLEMRFAARWRTFFQILQFKTKSKYFEEEEKAEFCKF